MTTDFEPKLIKMVELDANTGAIIREQEFENVEGEILKGINKDEAEHIVLQQFAGYEVVDSDAISVNNQSIWEVELTKESYKPEVVRIVQVDANTSDFITVKDLIK